MPNKRQQNAEVSPLAISAKRKRKIVVDNHEFYWYVGQDPWDKKFAKALHLVSPNRDFAALYRLDPVTEGSRCPKLQVIRSRWVQPGFYPLNEEVHEEAVTPECVRQILAFCLAGGETEQPENEERS